MISRGSAIGYRGDRAGERGPTLFHQVSAMPYYDFDPGAFEELAEEMEEMGEEARFEMPDPSGHTYEPAETTFRFQQTESAPRHVRDALLANGFQRVLCRYDGGYDEGFAYFEHAVKGDECVAAAKLPDQLADSPLADPKLLAAEIAGYPEPVQGEMRQRIEQMAPTDRIGQLLEDFAFELASSLLGEGFGTGEYSLRGQFQVELNSGRITDLKDEE